MNRRNLLTTTVTALLTYAIATLAQGCDAPEPSPCEETFQCLIHTDEPLEDPRERWACLADATWDHLPGDDAIDHTTWRRDVAEACHAGTFDEPEGCAYYFAPFLIEQISCAH